MVHGTGAMNMKWILALLLLCGQAWGQNISPAPGAQLTNIVQRPGIRAQAFGDSLSAYNAIYSVAGPLGSNVSETLYNDLGDLAWVARFSGRQITFDPTLGLGPVPYAGGVFSVVVTSPGNYSVAPTGATVSGCSNLVLGTPVMSGTGVASVPVIPANVTAVCNAAPGAAVSFSGGTGTAATATAFAGFGGTFAVPGITTAQMLYFLPKTLAAPVDVIFMDGGTNDITFGVSLATTEANLQSMWQQIMATGKSVVFFGASPRGQGGIANTTAGQQLQIYSLNTWERNWIAGQQTKRPSGYGNIFFIDREQACQDNTSATGAYLAICSADQLHENSGGAQIIGYQAWKTLSGAFGLAGQPLSSSRTDLYDATNNPGGALNPVADVWFTGTGGTVTAPCAGTLSGGWTLNPGATGTDTCVASIVSSRADLLSGNLQKFILTNGVGATTENYELINYYPVASLNINTFTATASFAANQVTFTGTPGGTIVSGQAITGTNVPAGLSIGAQISGTTGGAGVYGLSGTAGTITSGTVTLNDQLQVTVFMELSALSSAAGPGLLVDCITSGFANLNYEGDVNAGYALPNSTAYNGLAATVPIVLQSPAFSCPATTAFVVVNLSMPVNGVGGTATYQITDFAIRKVQ